ncbi:c-type cytochrome [Ruegeria arenilitoris]|uniref:c-type cytochrome n=1 Tax=Ruegeria arenilitoris TaxID=1173585 RepID=UPI00147AAD64|nr:c-type cytochrome [Ruegeria arenilitoris]
MKNRITTVFRETTPAIALVLMAATSAQAGSVDTFNSVCAECHTGGFKGFMSGAPNVRKPASWQKFLERDSEDRMREIVLRGTKDHKAKGGCTTCTDQQIIEVLDYLLERVR